jgi:hypothetical protein
MQTLSQAPDGSTGKRTPHLSRELHDEYGQSLTALKIKLQTIDTLPILPIIILRECINILECILHGIRQLPWTSALLCWTI